VDAKAQAEELAEASDAPLQPTAPQRVTLDQKPEVQGALFSLEVDTGDVLALVGGYDFFESEFNRVTQAKRQPGSAFKPFIYGAAIAHHYSPVSTLWDRPAVYTDPVSGFVWRPQNYGREFYGPIPMRTALVRSINNATVHLFRDLGVDYVIDFSRRLGIQSPLNRDLSLALGSSDVSLLEITTAYAVFPNHGRRVVPRFIESVTGIGGEIYAQNVPLGNPPPPVAPYVPDAEEGASAIDVAAGLPSSTGVNDANPTQSTQIIGEDAAYLMCDMLKAVVSDPRGTGWRLKALKRPLAGKTGTTNDQADAWFLGFSPDIATGVWVGHDESHVLGKGETGSRAAAPVWINYMEVALEERPVRDFEVPAHIEFHRIDRQTGLLADSATKDAYFQPFLENTQPTRTSANVSSASDARRALRDDSF
jgi:penicillin-binding protein 1A